MEVQQALNEWGNSSDQRDLVAFRLGDQTYALPVEAIVRIVEMVTITPVPQVSRMVEGVINVQGAIVPVVNLRRQFGLSEVALGLRTPIIIVQVGKQRLGVIVDEVIDVLSLSAQQVVRVADIMPDGVGETPLLAGLAHVEGDTVLVLDVKHLLIPGQARALAEAMANLPGVEVEEGAGQEVLVDAGNSEAQDAAVVDEIE